MLINMFSFRVRKLELYFQLQTPKVYTDHTGVYVIPREKKTCNGIMIYIIFTFNFIFIAFN